MLCYLYWFSSDLINHSSMVALNFSSHLAVNFLPHLVFLIVNLKAAVCKEKEKKTCFLPAPYSPDMRDCSQGCY